MSRSSETWAHEQLIKWHCILLQVSIPVHGPVGHEQLLLHLGSQLDGNCILDLLEYLRNGRPLCALGLHAHYRHLCNLPHRLQVVATVQRLIKDGVDVPTLDVRPSLPILSISFVSKDQETKR
jgi:hypothetical protein